MSLDDFNICLFEGSVKKISEEEFESFGLSEGTIQEAAQSLLPDDFNPEENIDVLPVVFNLAKVNEFNKNGDGIDAKTAVAAVKRFINKPINIEHKKDKIVGHMINASFSDREFDFKNNDIESYADKKEPFYINAAGLIYSQIYPELAQAISEASDEDDESYQSISTSWELAFKDFEVAKMEVEKEAKAKAEAELEELKDSFKQTKEELDSLKSDVEAKAAVDLFNDRMNFVDNDYDLNEKEMALVTAEVKELGSSEEDFNSYKEKLEVIFAHKLKKNIEAQEADIKARIEEAVANREEGEEDGDPEEGEDEAEEKPEEELEAEGDEAEAAIPNNNAEASESISLVDRLKKSFEVEVS
jgi:uncharacterized protein YoxC